MKSHNFGPRGGGAALDRRGLMAKLAKQLVWVFEFLRGKVKISQVGIVQKVKKVKKSARLLLYSINTLASQRVACAPTTS